MELTFLGATGTVTGSRYLLKDGGKLLLIDCGLYQGLKSLRLRNWSPFPVEPRSIEAVVLTHAHIDHSGYLPVLVKHGFAGKVYCSAATRDLCAILLPDAGHLQEEEARYANQHRFAKHKPALPLFTKDDADAALRQLVAVEYKRRMRLNERMSFTLQPAGHILGASSVLVEAEGHRVVFSGDLGRAHDAIMYAPAPVEAADYVVVESTYGNRRHPQADPEDELAGHLRRALRRGGTVVIPTFAVGRAQTLLHHLARLRARREIPDVPIYLNSPMAVDATRLYRQYRHEHRLTPAESEAAGTVAKIVHSADDSRALNERKGPMIILSASGMATGGRVVHHIKAFAPDARNMILFAGFQAAGTRGAAMAAGSDSVKIHGEYVPVRAEVVCLDSLSAHADYAEVLDWLRGIKAPPKKVFVTHGEPAAADEMRRRIVETFDWDCEVAEFQQSVTLR